MKETSDRLEIFSAILDSFNEGICFVNSDKRIIYANKELLRIHKLKEEDIIGKSVGEIFPGTGHVKVLETGEQNKMEEIYFDTTGAKVRPQYKPLLGADNKMIGSVGVSKELSRIKEVALELRSHNSIYEQFSLVFNNLQEAIVATDMAGKVLYANQRYADICNTKLSDLTNVDPAISGLAAIITTTIQESKLSKEKLSLPSGQHLDVICLPLIVDENTVGSVCIIQDITQLQKLNEKLEHTKHLAEYFKQQLYEKDQLPPSFDAIVGKSKFLKEALAVAARAAQTSCKILVRGDNGVGKEMVAKAIHHSSPRANGPFVCVNCAAVPDTLLESELFGYDEGAFTGARRGGKPGKFELANGGTLFLDEVGDMNSFMQAKLLRVLQEMEVERVGGTKSRKLDVRVISATNRDLEKMIEGGQFREDLYYRLNVVTIVVPALKDRKEDIPPLVDFFLQKHSDGNGSPELSPLVIDILMAYDWPGNIRELSNVVERATILAAGGMIQPYHLPTSLHSGFEEAINPVILLSKATTLEQILAECEKQALLKALEEANNNKTQAMKILDLSRRAFYYKANKYGIL
ncbi:MAG TPA: sigma 54-interacting transcriptional regulator [Negativicutes bacterium]|nr:sigma 54-interacting transcriptional regulator [Negativicutes bacterium]